MSYQPPLNYGTPALDEEATEAMRARSEWRAQMFKNPVAVRTARDFDEKLTHNQRVAVFDLLVDMIEIQRKTRSSRIALEYGLQEGLQFHAGGPNR